MLYLILNYLKDLLRPQHDLLLENLALRQQILVLERQQSPAAGKTPNGDHLASPKLAAVLAMEEQTQGLWSTQCSL